MSLFAQKTKEEAIEAMITQNYPKIYAYLYRRTREEALSKDLTQETFYRFFAHQHRYEESGKCLNYLYRIASHLLLDEQKSLRAKNVTLQEQDFIQEPGTLAKLQKKEEGIILRKWMYELPDHLQEIVILRCDEELKFHEIASILETPVSTVKSRWKMAVSLLQEKARKEGWK